MAITVTTRAACELKDLMVAEEKPSAALRVWVSSGGCSGLQYGMAIDDGAPEPTDQIFECDGVKIYVDELSLGYMDGSSVDFVEDHLGGGFKIENPNARSGCGCGSSFQTEESQASGGGCGGCGSRG